MTARPDEPWDSMRHREEKRRASHSDPEISRFLDRFLEERREKREERRRVIGLAVDADILERFMDTVPRRKAGETLTALMRLYLAAYENTPRIVQTTIFQSFHIAPRDNAQVTVNIEAELARNQIEAYLDWLEKYPASPIKLSEYQRLYKAVKGVKGVEELLAEAYRRATEK